MTHRALIRTALASLLVTSFVCAAKIHSPWPPLPPPPQAEPLHESHVMGGSSPLDIDEAVEVFDSRLPGGVGLGFTKPGLGALAPRIVQGDHGYRAPMGLLEHLWGDPVATFLNMQSEPLAAFTVPAPPKSMVFQKSKSPGSYVLAEYERRGGQWIQSAGASINSVSYLFCGFGRERLPKHFGSDMKLCGARMRFVSEIADADTNYDRILALLIRLHGYPRGYDPARASITSPNEPDGTAQQPTFQRSRFREWRWCPIRGDDKFPRCFAAVALVFDPSTQAGEVLYATPLLFLTAWAAHWNGADEIKLWPRLGGYSYEPQYSCTGTNICRPSMPLPLSAKERLQFLLH